MSTTAVVILNYNGKDYLKKFLPSLVKFTSNHSIIIADNNSTDESLQFLKDNYPDIRLIKHTENLGFARGYNEALSQIHSDFYALLNSDVEVTEGWIEPLIDFLVHNENYSACQPKILSLHDPSKFEYAGAAGGFMDPLGYPYCRGRIFNSTETDLGQYDEPIDVFWASGACMVVRASIFHELGGFDEDFFAHMEEIDLCWRIHSANKKIKCIPASKIFHVGGGTLSKIHPQKTYLNFRNGLALLVKNMPFRELIWKLPLRIFLDIIASVKFWVGDSFGHFGAILKAHFHFLLGFNTYIRKRKLIKQSSIDKKLSHTKFLAFDHYVLGMKTFNELDQ